MPVSKLDLEENLRPALIEALREDWEDTMSGEDTLEMSLRQRRRFRKMLADPQGYCRRYFRGESRNRRAVPAFLSARWKFGSGESTLCGLQWRQ